MAAFIEILLVTISTKIGMVSRPSSLVQMSWTPSIKEYHADGLAIARSFLDSVSYLLNQNYSIMVACP